MPLEFLTNNKSNELFFEGRKYTFINFSLKQKKANPPNYLIFKRKFFGFFDLLSEGFSWGFSKIFRLAKKTSLDIPVFQNKYNIFQTYLESHDNLILDLYYKNLILLPIHLSVLDFQKIGSELPSAVEQAEYTTK